MVVDFVVMGTAVAETVAVGSVVASSVVASSVVTVVRSTGNVFPSSSLHILRGQFEKLMR